jgi:hypothetical protein
VDFIKKFFDLKGNPNKENENDDSNHYFDFIQESII